MRLETDRLIIRDWAESDREAYARIVADPLVRRFFLETLTRAEADAAIDRYVGLQQRDGFSLLALERKSDGALLGHVGLVTVNMPVRGNPPVEIGWLLDSPYWGQGYAPEAARAWIDYGFETLQLREIAAWTAVPNLPSQRVMQKLGMTYDPADDFEHPRVPEGHPLRPHVVYRIGRPSGSA